MEKIKLSKVIKELTEQISLKEISTRDFVSEMETMYNKIETTENNYENSKKRIKVLEDEKDVAERKLTGYKIDFVTPAKELEKKTIELKYKHLDWKVEKEYMEKENRNLKQIIASLTASKTINTTDGNGGSRNEYMNSPALE